ncbi:MAG: hypothetical protein IKK06_03900 [Clostridia bacterium]|nr:hypothetical protein [Clostridia bacterium]
MAVNLPEAFLERMKTLLGEEYPAFLAEYHKESTRALYKTAEVEPDFPTSPIAHLPHGYTFDTEKPGNHPFHHAGAFYVQDPSAMATVAAVPFREGMRCLDLCASPGGKTVQMAHRMGKEGFLVSNEINPSRCKVLYGNVERMGFDNVQVTNADPKRIAAWYPDFFDLVTVDAPAPGRECSASTKTLPRSGRKTLPPSVPQGKRRSCTTQGRRWPPGDTCCTPPAPSPRRRTRAP